jgi:hypothetical protein
MRHLEQTEKSPFVQMGSCTEEVFEYLFKNMGDIDELEETECE